MGLNTPLLVRSRSLWLRFGAFSCLQPGFGARCHFGLGFGAGRPLDGACLAWGAHAASEVGVTALVCAK